MEGHIIPPPCDLEVFKKGEPLLAADTGEDDCGADMFEQWVQRVAAQSGQKVDWHYSGGVASVLCLGDRAKAAEAARKIPCPGRIMRWFDGADPGLYRAGVTPIPEGTLAGFYEPGASGSTFVTKE